MGTPGYEVEESVYHVAVEPGDRCRDATEDNPVCDELIHLVDVETMIGCTVQSGKTFGKFICQRLLLTQVHASGQDDGRHSNHYTCDGYLCLKMDGIRFTVGADEMSERNETGHASDGGQED